ncbi:MAG: FAD-binding oxidoreductase [Vicinamibacterales bacterium]|jgi:glycolate oxidase FAD binding subunit|nr:FAD-binding oxidoreductase [Vicinamibacterales bacterium]
MLSQSSTPDALVAEVNARVGAAVARPGSRRDSIDGVAPGIVATPQTATAVAAMLAWATETGRTAVVRGGGTKLGWGAPSGSVDLVLSTAAMNAVDEHRHGDLTATVQAGATLAETNAVLSRHRQWLPLDPPWGDRATIGGIVATNDSGPRRQRHGAPRDLIIGMTLVRADGVLAKTGGIVVKNVAGYDLARLMTGSFGCLGVILSVTFKLAPVAAASRTVAVEFSDAARCGPFVADLLAHSATPTALELAIPPTTMLVRFESVEPVAVEQAEQAATLARGLGGTPTILIGEDETAVWQAHDARLFDREGTIVKLVILAGELSSTLAWLDDAAQTRQLDYEVTGRAGLGVLYVGLGGDVPRQASLVTALRERIPAGRGSAVIQRADPELKALLDVWGPVGDGLRIMQEVKRRFDPTRTLNRGRGPGGL